MWHCLAVVTMVLVPIRLQFDVFWNLDPDTKLLIGGAAIAYLASVTLLTLISRYRGDVRLLDLVLSFGPMFTGLFFFLAMHPPVNLYPRVTMFMLLILAGMLGLLPLALGPLLRKAAIPALVLVIVGCVLPSVTHSAERNIERKVIRTNTYNLLARFYRNRLEEDETGGGLARFRDRYLLATGDGSLYSFVWDARTQDLELRQLPHRVPLNRADFLRDTTPTPGRIFRAADILVDNEGDGFRLFAAHHYWWSDKHCVTVRLSMTTEKYSSFLNAQEPAQWKTLYESTPCMPFDRSFAGHQMGGALQRLDARTLLMTVGDFDHDGVHAQDRVSQNENAAYGKTLAIDTETGAASIYTIGHRNPQGLYINPDGRIWSSEHGPRGGDELNLIVKGRNYGWPIVTYGINYDQPVWPLNPHQGRHEDYEPPVYAWVPSVGISSITSVQGERFGFWKNDLLVASLGGLALWRMRPEHGRMTTIERIEIGERIRDVIEDDEGRLILFTERTHPGPTEAALVVVEPVEQGSGAEASALRGELLFARCVGCHANDGNGQGIGPALSGVVNRRIAGANGFNYSEALRRLSGEWTEQKLDAFLAAPEAFAPGTSMQAEGISDPADRAALIQYLKTR